MKRVTRFRSSHGSACRAVTVRRRVSRLRRSLPPIERWLQQGGSYRSGPQKARCHAVASREGGFSLLEVVIALGVITVGIVAILGLVPTALQTGHSAQDETRAAHIAQSVFGSLVAAAPSQFSAVPLPPTSVTIDLTASHPSPTPPALYADNESKLTGSATNAAYAIFIYTNNAPPGFATVPPTANQVTVRVAWPANAPAANQTFRDYVRIVSKY